MQPIAEPITGREKRSRDSSPVSALVEFYAAFNTRSLDLVAQNWARTDEIAMDNPLGGIKRGWEEIRGVYERIFRGPAEVYVEFYDYTIHEAAGMFYVVGRERGYFRLRDTRLELAIRTSRIFRWMEGRWRQVHHHGSIDDPGLLKRYQSAVLEAS